MTVASWNVAAILTPAGRGAVATIGVRGPDADSLIARRFLPHGSRPLQKAMLREVRVGRWREVCGEEVVLTMASDDVWEIHCHGGRAPAAAILRDLAALGCATIEWADWMAMETPDPIAREARRALATISTERAAGVVLDQLNGALRRALEVVDDLLADATGSSASLQSAAKCLHRIRGFSSLGMHLTEPWKIVIAGRPNVGKSSLANALVGYERSIVFDRPGTTRDAVSVSTAVDGWPVLLVDTAGLRDAVDEIEAAGVGRTQQRLATADLALLVLDASQSWTQEDETLAKAYPSAIHIWNKCDLVSGPIDGRGQQVSAKTGTGIATLLNSIASRLVPSAPEPGDAVAFTSRQIAAIDVALMALERGARADARNSIRAICTD